MNSILHYTKNVNSTPQTSYSEPQTTEKNEINKLLVEMTEKINRYYSYYKENPRPESKGQINRNFCLGVIGFSAIASIASIFLAPENIFSFLFASPYYEDPSYKEITNYTYRHCVENKVNWTFQEHFRGRGDCMYELRNVTWSPEIRDISVSHVIRIVFVISTCYFLKEYLNSFQKEPIPLTVDEKKFRDFRSLFFALRDIRSLIVAFGGKYDDIAGIIGRKICQINVELSHI